MPVRAGDYWRVDSGFINGSAATFVVQWIPLTGGSGGSGTTAGVSAMASLTDVTLTNPQAATTVATTSRRGNGCPSRSAVSSQAQVSMLLAEPLDGPLKRLRLAKHAWSEG